MATRKHQWMVDDRLWDLISQLIPPQPPPRGPGGRPWIDDRAALEGILFVLHTGFRWRRWVVERTISWVLRFKRLGLRYDRTTITLLPLLLLAVTLIDLRRMGHASGL